MQDGGASPSERGRAAEGAGEARQGPARAVAGASLARPGRAEEDGALWRGGLRPERGAVAGRHRTGESCLWKCCRLALRGCGWSQLGGAGVGGFYGNAVASVSRRYGWKGRLQPGQPHGCLPAPEPRGELPCSYEDTAVGLDCNY